MDYEVIKELIEGRKKPEETYEFALIEAFVKSSNGEPLINLCIDNKEKVDNYSKIDLQFFLLGYAMGQKDFLDKLDGLDLNKFKEEDEPIH